MVDTQQDFQTKRLLDMVEDKIPQFLIEFRKLNDVLLDILLLIADNTKERITNGYRYLYGLGQSN